MNGLPACRATTADERAFNVDNTYYYLNNIPFSDHGALLDPPTEDVTGALRADARAAWRDTGFKPGAAAGHRLSGEHSCRTAAGMAAGGMNYIYGTWSVLCALNAAGIGHQAPEMRKAADWLIRIQNQDGGWGEDGASYKLDYKGYETAPSTSSQTAWALLALMAAGEARHEAVARGIAYLARTQGNDGLWEEELFTATGFPRVFYLRYHGYRKFFPLWAMARYRNLQRANTVAVSYGM